MSAPRVLLVKTARKSAQMAVSVKTALNSVSAKTRRTATPKLDNVFVLPAGRALVAIDPVKKEDSARTVLCSAIATTMGHVMLKREIVPAQLAGSAILVIKNAILVILDITVLKNVNVI